MEITLNKKDINTLKRICTASWDDLKAYGVEYGIPDDPDPTKRFIFKDNGADVLMVAHTDSVYPASHFYNLIIANDNTVMCPTLDDRLGVYTICELLPKLLGNNLYDILLTDGEERGKSTAVYFEPPRQYNWIVEFDRHGDDLVFYQYGGNVDAVRELKKAGFRIGIGSFSDIAELSHCECTAFNVGVGYYNEHSTMAYMVIDEYLAQIKNFIRFWHTHKDTFFPFVRTVQAATRYITPYTSPPNPYKWHEDDDGVFGYDTRYGYFDNTKPKSPESNSLDPKTWNAFYDDETESNKNLSKKRDICEICERIAPLHKVSDIYICEDCAFVFQDEIDYLNKNVIEEESVEDEWSECDACGCWVDINDMAFIDFEDGLGEQLFCKVCCAKYGGSHKVIPISKHHFN